MRKLLKIPLYVVILLAIGIIAGHFTFQALSFSRTVTVPDVRGKSTIEANNILKDKELYIRIEGEDYDALIPEGYIIRQDVPSGNKVKEGREIKVVLSKGPKVKYVPDVVGQTLDDAEAQLRGRGIRIKKIIYVHSEDVPKDSIVAQRPEVNESGADMFSVIVSLGGFDENAKVKSQHHD
ncbi:MAG: PASTA domain-containing protein [Dissulfurispiraceae bacterium]